MFDSNQKSTGTRYTITFALLTVACVFGPAVLLLSRPFGTGLALTVLAISASCLVMAWVNWKLYSHLSIPTLEKARRSN